MEPVRWGIAGFGWVASDYMAPAIQAAGDRLVAVADPGEAAQARAAALGVRAYRSVEEMAADESVEAIYVATPNHLHRAAVEAAAAGGKAVLCEKPIAADLADAEAIVEACSQAGILYGTAFDQRHHPAHGRMRELIAQGRIGRPTALRIVYACWLGPDWTTGHGTANWRASQAEAGGGALMDLAPHGLDLTEFLLGERIEDVSCLLQRRVHDYEVDDGGVVIGRTASGMLATLHVAYNCPDALPRRRLEVAGSQGLLVARNTMGQDGGGTLQLVDGADGSSHPIDFEDASPFTNQVRAFDRALRGKERGAFSGARDLHTMRLLQRAYEDSRREGPIP